MTITRPTATYTMLVTIATAFVLASFASSQSGAPGLPSGANVLGTMTHQDNTPGGPHTYGPETTTIPRQSFNGQVLVEGEATSHAGPSMGTNTAHALSRQWDLTAACGSSDSAVFASLFTSSEPVNMTCVQYTSAAGGGDLYGSVSRLESRVMGSVQSDIAGQISLDGELEGEQTNGSTPLLTLGLGLMATAGTYGGAGASVDFPWATWTVSYPTNGPDGHVPVALPQPGSSTPPNSGPHAGSNNFSMPHIVTRSQGSKISTSISVTMQTAVSCSVSARGLNRSVPAPGSGVAAFTKAELGHSVGQGYFLFPTPTVPTILVFPTLCTICGTLVGPPGSQIVERDGGGLLIGRSGETLVEGGPGVITVTEGPGGTLVLNGGEESWAITPLGGGYILVLTNPATVGGSTGDDGVDAPKGGN